MAHSSVVVLNIRGKAELLLQKQQASNTGMEGRTPQKAEGKLESLCFLTVCIKDTDCEENQGKNAYPKSITPARFVEPPAEQSQSFLPWVSSVIQST